MLNNSNYKELLSKDDKVIVLLGGEGCANCITMYPIVNKFASLNPSVIFYNIEVNENCSNILDEYLVEKVPSVLLFNKGNLIAKISGYQPYEIFELYVQDKFKM